MAESDGRVTVRVGALLLLLQPLVILVQLVVAARWAGDGGFDPTRNTISDLGVVGCTTIQASYGAVDACSPWHVAMNSTFVAIGAMLALGAVLVVPALPGRVLRLVVAALLVVAGVSSAAVGFVPLDVDADLHTLVATPLFAAQPLALLLAAVLLRRTDRPLAGVLLGLGLLAAAGCVAFGATLVTGDVGGLYERLGLWSCHVGLGLLGLRLLGRLGRGSSGRRWPGPDREAGRIDG